MTKKQMINELGIVGDKFMRRDVKKVYDAWQKDKANKEFYKSLLIK